MDMDVFETTLQNAINRAAGNGTPPQLASAIRDAVFPGGARVRPQLCLAVAQACQAPAPRFALKAAAALEIIHCASLVHDDLPCFDNADIRRGQSSIHKAYGEEIAVLTGNTLIITAFNTLTSDAEDPASERLAALQILTRYTGAPHGICAGQAWESEADIDVSRYHQAKTGALFMAACELGAASTGAPSQEWRELGRRIGEAYQVADDLKDATSSLEAEGKPVARDAALGRPSSVVELGIDGSVAHLKDLIQGAIASVPACPGEAWLCELIRHQAKTLLPVIPDHTGTGTGTKVQA